MGLADTLARIPKILEANFNALLDKCENPEKMVDQLLIDYKKDLANVKRDTAAVMADVKTAQQRLEECDTAIARKKRAAENALRAGNEDDARALLAAKQSLEITRENLLQNLSVARKNAGMMQEGYNRLVRNIEELEGRRNAARAKMSMARAKDQMNKSISGTGSANMDVFHKYEQEADRMLAEADAEAELNAGSIENLTAKYDRAGTSSIDAELAELKADILEQNE